MTEKPLGWEDFVNSSTVQFSPALPISRPRRTAVFHCTTLFAASLWICANTAPSSVMAQCVNITWRALSPETTPPLNRRGGHAMAYDSNRSVTVLYGGGELFPYSITGTGTFGDHWEYDGIIWRQISPTTKPPPLVYSFDELRRGSWSRRPVRRVQRISGQHRCEEQPLGVGRGELETARRHPPTASVTKPGSGTARPGRGPC